MDKDFSFPILSNPIAVLAILAIFVIVFHVLLIKLWPLGKKGWKIVDYVWLGVAVLGILGAAGAMRRQLAKAYVDTAEIRARGSYELARYQMTSLTGIAICQSFVKSEFSPKNLDEIQAEYTRTCEFGRAALNSIPAEMPKDSKFPNFGTWPEAKDKMLKEIFSEIDQAIDRYQMARTTLDQLRHDADYSSLDNDLLFVSPLLFAVAVALRITKVTGELRSAS